MRDVVEVAKRLWRDKPVRDVEFEMHGDPRVDMQDLSFSRYHAEGLTLKTPSKNWKSRASPSRHDFDPPTADEVPSCVVDPGACESPEVFFHH